MIFKWCARSRWEVSRRTPCTDFRSRSPTAPAAPPGRRCSSFAPCGRDSGLPAAAFPLKWAWHELHCLSDKGVRMQSNAPVFVEINPQAVRDIIRDQNLKVWWVAEFAGV